MERRNRDLAIALFSFLVPLLCANFYIFRGQVNSFGAPAQPGYQAVRHIWEMAYQEIPVRWTTANIIRAGYFPSWTPYPEAGTPLIGKMQNGIFYPFHILYYLASARLRPWAFTLIVLLSQTFAFICLYIFARLVGLPLLLSIIACSCVVFSTGGSNLSPNYVTALFLPLLLAFAELYHRGEKWRAFALWLLPPVTALAFFAGHFETAFRISAMAGIYFLVRAFQQRWSTGERLRRAASFAAAQALGVPLALVQILPGMEYVRWSYNRVWRTRPEFGWIYHTIQKHLGVPDIPLLVIGLAAAGGFIWMFKKLLREKNAQKSGALLAAAAAMLGISLAALMRVGLDGTLYHLVYGEMILSPWRGQFSIIFLFLAALAAAIFADMNPELKALCVLFALGSLIQIKAPPLSNLIASLPISSLFDNTQSTPELTLSACFLAAAGLMFLKNLTAPNRRTVAGKIVLGWAVVVGGWAVAWTLRTPLTEFFTTGTYSESNSNPQPALFTGPEQAQAFAGTSKPFRAESSLPCVSVDIAAVAGGKVLSAIGAQILSSFGECSFYGLLPLPAQPDDLYVMAKLTLPDGSSQIARGPEISTFKAPLWPFVAAAAAVPVTALVPTAGMALYAAIAASDAELQAPQPTSPQEFPFRLPGIDRIKTDSSLYRLSSFNSSFLEADYANLYGISDIRNGGDNLDVLPTIYFDFLTQGLLAKPSGSAERTLGLRLLGLANVKYLVDAPQSNDASPYLKKIYDGPDMDVYQNELAMPRAAFFQRAVEEPVSNILDWDAGRRLAFGDLPALFSQPGFDPQKTLVLDSSPGEEVPIEPPQEKSRGAGAGAVQIISYEPDRVVLDAVAPEAGYVFLSDNDFPGWHATVNSAPSPILRADLSFRAVRVPAGKSNVIFSYTPLPLEIGAAISALGFFLWLIFFMGLSPEIADGPLGQALLESWTARIIRSLVLGLILPAATYWALWTLFVFGGGIQNGFKHPRLIFPDSASQAASPSAPLK